MIQTNSRPQAAYGCKKPKIEVADILRKHIPDYLAKYRMPPEHYKVVYDILNCRTAYLGGHIEACDNCGTQRNAYNSCRNRHCPKCQTITKERWLEARKAELLPMPYFHAVFTLPHELNPVILCNKKVTLRILFKDIGEDIGDVGEKLKCLFDKEKFCQSITNIPKTLCKFRYAPFAPVICNALI
ncbi:MAG: transposase zinc-binding domain-containing protein, partial [Proteobacteria bacterium]|nr:transposase zinc-binding domain-containing protein [Pseudomonadota bacterium]